MPDHVRDVVSTAPSGTFDIANANPNTPVGGIFYLTSAVTDDTIADHCIFAWGACDGTNEFVLTVKNEDNQATADADRQQSFSHCLGLHDIAGGLEFSASFNSFIPGGARFNISTPSGAAYQVKAIYFYSTDVDEFDVIRLGLGSTTAPVTYSGLTYELDVLLGGHIYTNTTSNNVHSPFAMGVCYNDVALTPSQLSMGMCGDSGASAGDQNLYVSNSAFMCAPLLGSNRWISTISNVNGTGFTYTTTASTGTDLSCVSMKLAAGVSFDVFEFEIPTSGNIVITGLSFQPALVSLHSLAGPSAYNTLDTTSVNAASWATATLDSSTVFTESVTDDDGAPDTICKSLSSDQFRILSEDGASDAALASAHALTSDGLTLTLTSHPDAIIKGFGWAISGAAADTTAPVLTLPTAANVTSSTIDLGFTTDEDNGTGYWYISTSATPPSISDLKDGTGATSFGNGSISAAGIKSFAAVGALTESTSYYGHMMQTDAASNDSNILTTAQFTTTPSDVTAPILTSPATPVVDGNLVDFAATTDEANGTAYLFVGSSGTPPSAADLKAGTGAEYSTSQAVSATGVQSFTDEGPIADGNWYAHIIHTDAASNDSNIVTSSQFTVTTIAALTMEADDFDSALGTVASIVDAATLTPTINLTPDDQVDVPGWLMLCVRSATNMSGKTPEFVYSDADCRFTGTQNPCWRYLTDDRNTWYAFDNVATVTNTVTCSMNTPFTGEIEFATKPRWHYSDTQDWIAEVALDADAHELASSVAATTLPTNVFASVDPGATNANTFPQQDINLYGIRISNDAASPSVGDKWPVVLLMGAHASEDQGNYMLQGFVDYLLSGTALADRLLVDYDFYIYDVNPHGRAYGKERWSENDTTNSDLNRAWDGVPSGTVVDDIITAIGTDLSGPIKGMIDFHGNFQATRSFGAYYDPTNPYDIDFKTRMEAKVTEGFYPFYGPNAVGTSGEWGVNEGALFSITQEAEYYPAGHPDISAMYDQQGFAIAETLDEMRLVTQTSNLQQGQSLSSVSLVGGIGLTVDSLSQSQTIEIPALTEHASVTSQDMQQGQSEDTVSLTEHAAIAAQDLAQGHAFTEPDLAQHYLLAVEAIQQGQSESGAAFTEHASIVAQDLSQGQSEGEVSFLVGTAFSVDNLQQSTALAEVSLTQHNTLTPQAIQQGHSTGNVELVSGDVLNVNNITQSTTTDEAGLTQHNVLVVASLQQEHTGSGVSLADTAPITAQDLQQGQSSEEATLNFTANFVVDDLSQGQSLMEALLSQKQILLVDDLTQEQLLSHAGSNDSVIVVLRGSVSIQPLLGGKITIQ